MSNLLEARPEILQSYAGRGYFMIIPPDEIPNNHGNDGVGIVFFHPTKPEKNFSLYTGSKVRIQYERGIEIIDGQDEVYVAAQLEGELELLNGRLMIRNVSLGAPIQLSALPFEAVVAISDSEEGWVTIHDGVI